MLQKVLIINPELGFQGFLVCYKKNVKVGKKLLDIQNLSVQY
jgi:hypothetical protein